MEKFIHINNEFYSLKFGTKCLIQLNEFSKNISDQELIKLKFLESKIPSTDLWNI